MLDKYYYFIPGALSLYILIGQRERIEVLLFFETEIRRKFYFHIRYSD